MKLYEILVEGFRGDWAILPSTMALYGRRTVDIVTAASEWKDHDDTILICTKRENGKERFLFVSSSGDVLDHWEKQIGKSFSTYHGQTGQSKGDYKLVNVAVLKDGKILKSANDTGLKARASLSVFK